MIEWQLRIDVPVGVGVHCISPSNDIITKPRVSKTTRLCGGRLFLAILYVVNSCAFVWLDTLLRCTTSGTDNNTKTTTGRMSRSSASKDIHSPGSSSSLVAHKRNGRSKSTDSLMERTTLIDSLTLCLERKTQIEFHRKLRPQWCGCCRLENGGCPDWTCEIARSKSGWNVETRYHYQAIQWCYRLHHANLQKWRPNSILARQSCQLYPILSHTGL